VLHNELGIAAMRALPGVDSVAPHCNNTHHPSASLDHRLLVSRCARNDNA
jgi:hypothetical protein